MTVPEFILTILVCPSCKSPLVPDQSRVLCRTCRVAYPVRDGLPIMLQDEARPLEG